MYETACFLLFLDYLFKLFIMRIWYDCNYRIDLNELFISILRSLHYKYSRHIPYKLYS